MNTLISYTYQRRLAVGAFILYAALTAGVFWGRLFTAEWTSPITDPDWTAEQVTAFYTENRGLIQVGVFSYMIGTSFLIPLAVLIAARTRMLEKRFAFFSMAQLVAFTGCYLVLVFMGILWTLAAFRAGSVSPELTQAFNDLAWLITIYGWPPFAAWILLMALPVFLAPPGSPTLPRWWGYFSILEAIAGGTVINGLVAFFKTGPFAYNGLISVYLPLGLFAVYLLVTTVMLAFFDHQHPDHPPRAEEVTPPESDRTLDFRLS
ncbi:hypothetical protein [Nocardia takedensis]|uniref:hypothetical protein n=1 Tax=Nocardia takedensis TaxID=259390 RepID=UPI0002FC7419|nr:hypothetical protein [Nocardia takedensis]